MDGKLNPSLSSALCLETDITVMHQQNVRNLLGHEQPQQQEMMFERVNALQTSGGSLSSLAASGGAVCNVLEVCYLHSGVGPETLFKPLHQGLYALLIGVQC